jgi:hypothetical protein
MRPQGYDEEVDLRIAHDTPLAQNFSVSTPTFTTMLFPGEISRDVIARTRRTALRLGRRDRVAEEEISEFYGFPAFAQVLDEAHSLQLDSSSQLHIALKPLLN